MEQAWHKHNGWPKQWIHPSYKVNWLTEKRVALFALIIRLAQEQRWNVTPLMQNANYVNVVRAFDVKNGVGGTVLAA